MRAQLATTLPADWERAQFVGRVQLLEGPTPVYGRGGVLFDASRFAPTSADFIRRWARGERPLETELSPLSEQLAGPEWAQGEGAGRLLAPCDLQSIKACGVTFAVSAVERVIEERAGGDPQSAETIRHSLAERVGGDIRSVRPGSEAAARLKAALRADGLWSQYLEVAIGPDAEVFTKAQPLSAVGSGAFVGVRPDSAWNNPEPEIVLACTPDGAIVGAALGNDVNLRDIEGRSALLLGEAKDNNASCAIGPLIRLFDDGFGLDDVRHAVVSLRIEGEDGFVLEGASSMDQISRDPTELAAQVVRHHQYPDGFMLFLGTMFAPTQDRGAAGEGFTHQLGDLVEVFTPCLGRLINRVTTCDEAPPWSFGLSDLMHNLAARGVLKDSAR